MLINGNEVEAGGIGEVKYSSFVEKSYIKEVEQKMSELIECSDTEAAHSDADQILCDFLATLGFGELVSIYNKVPKWYA